MHIPLRDFAEHGAWENEWFNPIGAFDWQAVDRFDIVAEHHALDGIQFWFDELRIVGPALTAVLDEAASQPDALALAANYPNPFNATTAIRYALPAAGPVHLAVYALNGQQVRTSGAGCGDGSGVARGAMGWARRCGAGGGQRRVSVSLGCCGWSADREDDVGALKLALLVHVLLLPNMVSRLNL